jgi:two-component system response regulator (stage 0 sporulation protein F)
MTPRRRILIVDDDPMVLFVFRDTLKALGDGYEIVTTLSGLEALDEIKEQPFDLVITDHSMPNLGGVQLTEAIRQTSPDTAVVWITAYGCHSRLADAERLGIYRCCDKPLEVHEILQIAREALGQEAAGNES